MKKIKYYFIAGMALLFSAGAFAQEDGLTLKLDYSAAFPVGSFKNNVISNNSFKGFGASLMYHIDHSFAVGIETGSQYFYQKYPRGLYKTSDGSDISAVLSNTVQTVPVLLKGQFTIIPDGIIQPFIAVGVGGNIIDYNQYAGEFSNDYKTRFGFAARPEAGFYIPFKKYSRTGFSVSAAYNYMPFNYNGISNLNNVSAKAGLSIGFN